MLKALTLFPAECLKIGVALDGQTFALGLATPFLYQHICITVNWCGRGTNTCQCVCVWCDRAVSFLEINMAENLSGTLDADQGRCSFTSCSTVTSMNTTWPIHLLYKLSINNDFHACCGFTVIFVHLLFHTYTCLHRLGPVYLLLYLVSKQC